MHSVLLSFSLLAVDCFSPVHRWRVSHLTLGKVVRLPPSPLWPPAEGPWPPPATIATPGGCGRDWVDPQS